MQVNGSVKIVGLSEVETSASVPSQSSVSIDANVDNIPNINISAKDGVDGKSAYEQAVEGGFVGTEQEFINSLNNLNEIKNIMPLVYAGL